MSTLDILLVIISFVSFGLAIYSFIRSEIKKSIERSNVEIMREKLKSLYQGLGSLFHSADAMVQIPKKRSNIKVEEMQNLARVLRGQIYFQLEKIKKSRSVLDEWKYGKLIKSEQLDETKLDKIN